jgi:hypothetical protein
MEVCEKLGTLRTLLPLLSLAKLCLFRGVALPLPPALRVSVNGPVSPATASR